MEEGLVQVSHSIALFLGMWVVVFRKFQWPLYSESARSLRIEEEILAHS
jgi:hypothetical protein